MNATRAYYNENEPFAAAWLRELIAHNLIAPGDVDERSIADVRPDDLAPYSQCHFFAGIGGWSYALRLAGWPDSKPVWTGSCPCQPFSQAGTKKGFSDTRHLWPLWFSLISECHPHVIFSEQVASALSWLDLVSGDLEAQDYAIGPVVLGAHSIGSPHMRKRLYFVAESQRPRQDSRWSPIQPTEGNGAPCSRPSIELGRRSNVSIVAHPTKPRRPDAREHERRPSPLPARPAEHGRMVVPALEQVGLPRRAREPRESSVLDHASGNGRFERRSTPSERRTERAGIVGDANESRSQGRRVSGAARSADGPCELASGPSRLDGQKFLGDTERSQLRTERSERLDAPSSGLQGENGQRERLRDDDRQSGAWSDCDWLPCIDGKSRPVEPGTFPLAHGIPGRVGRLRGYGNAIVPQVAQAFIESYMEIAR